MNRLAIFLADGFEEIEALAVVDICRRGGLTIDMISIMGKTEVTGSHGIMVKADGLFEDAVIGDYDMLILPGGMPGTLKLEAHEALMQQVDEFYAAGKKIGAICAAPSIFGHKGILKGRRACSYPTFENQLEGAAVTSGPVEISDNVITSRGMGTAIDFGLAILGVFCGQEMAQRIAKAIIYQDVSYRMSGEEKA